MLLNSFLASITRRLSVPRLVPCMWIALLGTCLLTACASTGPIAESSTTSGVDLANSGRLLDAETGAPIANAAVFQIAWRTQLTDLEDTPRAVRWTTTDASGNFRFTSRFLGGRVGAKTRTSFDVYHPEYGILQVTAKAGDSGKLSLPLLRRYTDANRLSRAVWESGLSCPENLPEEYCLQLCRTLIGQEEVCRDPKTIRGTQVSVPKGFTPPRVFGNPLLTN